LIPNYKKYIMKNILLFLALSSTILFSSCQGDQGPPGEPGINIYGKVFEANVTFQYDALNNLYSNLVTIPNSIEVYESDVILVYRLGVPAPNGDDVWEPIPQSIFFSNGNIMQYVFDHTFYDVKLYIDGNFNLSLLNRNYTDNQIFRIAILPAEYGSANLTMDDLLQGLQINPTEIETID
jgi:hypothetical protein